MSKHHHPEDRAERLAQETVSRKEVNAVLLRSKGGAHGKSNKAKRAGDKNQLRREVYH